MGTTKLPLRERHELPVSALRAVPAGVTGIYSNVFPTGTLSLVGKKGCKLTPSYICDTLSQAMVTKHTVDTQILNGYDTKAVDDTPAMLVSKVRPLVSYAFMNMGNRLSLLYPLGCALFSFTQPTLRFGQCLLIGPKKARVEYALVGGKSSKIVETNINPHHFGRFQQWLVLNHAAKGDKPFTGAGASDTASLNLTLKRTVNFSLDQSYLGQLNGVGADFIATLRISKAVIPTFATKARVAGLFANPHPSKKGLKGKVDAHRYILQYLAVNIRKAGPFLLQCREGINLVVQAKGFATFFPAHLALLKQVVVKPPALIQDMLHGCRLSFSRIQPVAEGFLMHSKILTQYKEASQALSGFADCISSLKKGVLVSG